MKWFGNIGQKQKEAEVVELQGNSKQNFGLSRIDFDVMIEKLKDGDESIFEHVFLAHFGDCMSYLKQNYSVEHERAYDITMDTLIIFRGKLLEGKIDYGNLRYLFTKMASQVFLKEIEKHKRLQDVIIEEEVGVEYSEELFDALAKVWDEFDGEEKIILQAYYYDNTPLSILSTKMGISDVSIRKKKQRAMEKLKNNFFNNYID
jgi:RNA polymerase sigma factor (sigma-70 family)